MAMFNPNNINRFLGILGLQSVEVLTRARTANNYHSYKGATHNVTRSYDLHRDLTQSHQPCAFAGACKILPCDLEPTSKQGILLSVLQWATSVPTMSAIRA